MTALLLASLLLATGNPTPVDPLTRGDALQSEGKIGAALASWLDALDAHPSDAALWKRISEGLSALGLEEDAADAATQAWRFGEGDASARAEAPAAATGPAAPQTPPGESVAPTKPPAPEAQGRDWLTPKEAPRWDLDRILALTRRGVQGRVDLCQYGTWLAVVAHIVAVFWTFVYLIHRRLTKGWSARKWTDDQDGRHTRYAVVWSGFFFFALWGWEHWIGLLCAAFFGGFVLSAALSPNPNAR